MNISSHAKIRMQERGISIDQVKSVVNNGEKFDYYHDNTWKTGFYDVKSRIFVGK